jgi:C1A family cysteine protease
MTEEIKYVLANTIPSIPDQRDIPYRSPYKPEDLPGSVDMREDVYEIENQGSIGSCVANGVASSCELIANRNDKPIDLSRLFLYNATKVYENRLGEEGLYTRDAYHVAYKQGMPTEEYYPYDISKDDIAPSSEDYKEAFNNRIDRYENVIQWNSIDSIKKVHQIKSALHEGMPVGFAMMITASLINLKGSWKEHDYIGVDPDNTGLGGHYMLIVGYDDEHCKFLVQNSWGTSWGDGGYCGLPYNMVSEPFFEAWIARSFKGMEVPETTGSKVDFKSKYVLEARIVPEKEDIGKTVKVWMGGIDTEGNVYIKQPVPSIEASVSGMPDLWLPVEESGLIPVQENYVLDNDNHIKVINWLDLSKYKGSEIYVGFGTDEFNMRVDKIVTL